MLTFEPDIPKPFLRKTQSEAMLEESAGNSIPPEEYSIVAHSTSTMRPPVRVLMLPQSPRAGEGRLLVKSILCAESPCAVNVPSTTMPVPFSNATATPGSIFRKTPTRTNTSAVTLYGLPDKVQVVLVAIAPPTAVSEFSDANAEAGSTFSLQSEELMSNNISINNIALLDNSLSPQKLDLY
jgi:hypothetical protein